MVYRSEFANDFDAGPERWSSVSTSMRSSLSPVLWIAVACLVILGAVTISNPYFYVVFPPSVYLPVHALTEMGSVVVSFAIFAVYWNAADKMRDSRALMIGTAFLAVAIIDMMHMLSFPGMPDFVTPSSVEKGIFYWLAARLWAAFALLAAALVGHSPRQLLLRRRLLLTVNLGVAFAVFVAVSFFQEDLPHMFIADQGLTQLKIGLEYVVVVLSVITALAYLRAYIRTGNHFFRLMVMALILTVFSELSFTLYAAAYDTYNLLGHIYKVVAYYFIFRALFTSAVQRPYAELEGLYDQIDNQLKRTITELQVRNEELETFAYSVSHDLRAPLRHIDGFSQVLVEDYSDRLDEQGKEYLQIVRQGSQRMAQLIDDMLQLARVTRSDMRYERVDLSAIANEIVGQLQRQERQAEVVVATGTVVNGDPHLLRNVLENLLGNAWKFTGKREAPIIEFGAIEKDGRTVYFVRDNGAGFDMAYADKLFVPFQRLHHGDEFPGTGIGLATVQRIIRRHGGQIWAEGETEKGATFYFTL